MFNKMLILKCKKCVCPFTVYLFCYPFIMYLHERIKTKEVWKGVSLKNIVLFELWTCFACRYFNGICFTVELFKGSAQLFLCSFYWASLLFTIYNIDSHEDRRRRREDATEAIGRFKMEKYILNRAVS